MAAFIMWDPRHESMPREALEALQLKRLRDTVARIHARVPFYRKALDERGVTAQSLRSLADLRRLPLTQKSDLRDTYPFGLFAVPLADIVRIHASSGTTGKPIVVGYTREDLALWTEVMARVLTAGGVGRDDVVHNAYGYGLFTGGLGFHYGAERVGATVIPMSGGFTERQLQVLRDLGSSVLCCTPSYAIYLAEEIAAAGFGPRDLKLRVGFFGAEPWSEQMRREIEQRLGILAMDIYGLSEIVGPGVSVECPEQRGLHIFEDHFLPEVIDPATLEPLPPGQVGELVLTSLTKQAIPLLRYRTRDLTALTYEPCPCGRTGARMSKVTGRSDDMLIIRGVNLFPSQVESVLMALPELEPQYLLVVRRERALDELEVRVEAKAEALAAGPEAVERLRRQVEHEIRQRVGLAAAVRLVEPRTLERSVGKAKRVLDERRLDE
jgi:phenylacetate-CoA ligase